MSAELPLSTRILLVLNPSMFNNITNGSLWGCFTPLASASLKDMSWSVRLCLRGGTVWMLFTCLWHAFLRDLNDPPVMGPPAIVFISPIISWGGWCGRSSFLEENSRCLKLSIDNVGNLVNHSLAAPLRVVGKERHGISSGGCWRPNVVLKVLR